jgi:dihydrofolate reductase
VTPFVLLAKETTDAHRYHFFDPRRNQAPGAPDEDRSHGFQHGGWLVPHADDQLGAFMVRVFDQADAFLLGRGTYQIFAGHWPRVTEPADPIASRLNALPKHIATKTLDSFDWQPSSGVRDVAREVPKLVQRYGRELQVHGSAGLLQTLFALGLVQRLNLVTFPILLGAGKRLFEGGAAPSTFELRSSETTKRGVVLATYARTGKPSYGSFALDAAD